ncbi:MAG: hypothetical protein ACLUO4_03815 [Christensenellales bacterium]
MKLVFFGTPAFAVPVLRAVYEAGHTVLAVVTQPDRPKGRKKTLCPPEVKVCAEALGLPVLQFEKIKSPKRCRRFPIYKRIAGLRPLTGRFYPNSFCLCRNTA